MALYNKNIKLNSYKLFLEKPKKIVINPLTRVELKNITHNHLGNILDLLLDYEIYLIDFEKKYQVFENRVQHYYSNTTLDDVKQLILSSDLYIGGDSFVIHLSFYLKKNYFIIFYRDNDDFLPPNIEENFYIKAHKCGDFSVEIEKKFKQIGLIK